MTYFWQNIWKPKRELPSGNLIRGGQMPLVLLFPFSPAFDMNVMSRAVAAIVWLENERQDGKGGRAERERVWVCEVSLNYWTISVTAYSRFLLYFWDSSVLYKGLLLFIVYVLLCRYIITIHSPVDGNTTVFFLLLIKLP